LIHWKDFGAELDSPSMPRDCPVFILAGGKGTRMKPFTNILPKPLIPIGETPILEIIMHRFQKNGFNKFIISLNYRAEFVKLYFAESVEEYDLEFVQEEKFLGTGGSLHLIKNRFADTVIVSNCDVLLDIDFGDFLDYHKEQGNAATIVGVLRHVKIPYGVMEMRDGALVSFREKPEFDFIINAGIYAVEPEILSQIQENVYSDMPDILEKAKQRGSKIGIYPVSSDMVDIGHWDEYNKAVDFLKREKVISEDADTHRLNLR
ncbi:MAG: NTP transferase domain-containing protein, partial [Leptospiraceae bacterium]|nr:NTP transferase domain-containing protein [Leptospiraceae bacterium]